MRLFVHRLALQLGHANVDAMLDGMSAEQLTAWMAYEQIEPFGEQRADLRSATVAAVIANVNRDPKRQRKPFAPVDFMPKFRVKAQTTQQMLSMVEALNEAFGGKDLRIRKP